MEDISKFPPQDFPVSPNVVRNRPQLNTIEDVIRAMPEIADPWTPNMTPLPPVRHYPQDEWLSLLARLSADPLRLMDQTGPYPTEIDKGRK
jgi:hypothetical protein